MAVSHLGLEPRKRIACRLCCGEAIDGFLVEESPAASLLVERLRGDLRRLTTPAWRGTAWRALRLDQAVQQVASELCHLLVGGDEQIARDLRARLESAGSLIDCCRCAGPERSPCSGFSEDDAVVEDPGECIRYLHELFALALTASRACYSAYAPRSAVDAIAASEIRFRTAPCDREKPHDAPVEVFVGGSTRYDTRGGADVSLVIGLDGFDWRSFLASCYVLFHECFVHAFDSLLFPAGGARAEAAENDQFSEGWMDWLAIELMQSQLDRDGSPGPRYPDEFIREGLRLHDARADVLAGLGAAPGDPRAASKYAVSRNRGRAAAQHLDRFLCAEKRSLLPGKLSGRDALLQLSIDLNLHGDLRRERELFTRLTLRVLRSGANVAERNVYSALVHDYFRSRDVHRLARESADLVSRLPP